MHVCYLLILAIMPWLAIAGTLSALCGLLVCGEPGRGLEGGVMLTLSAGAWLIALDLLRAFARTADAAEYAEARRLLEASAGHDRPR